jgi:ketosteroid isomerase-like protein
MPGPDDSAPGRVPDELAATVRQLADRQAILDVAHAYCIHFDANEPDVVAALFTGDATVDYGPERPTIVGVQDIEASISLGLDHTFAATSHHLSNVRIAFDGADAADVLAYVYAWHRYVDGSPDGELWGRYRYRFVRTDAGWRIASLVLQAAGTVDFHRGTMHPIGRRLPPRLA